MQIDTAIFLDIQNKITLAQLYQDKGLVIMARDLIASANQRLAQIRRAPIGEAK